VLWCVDDEKWKYRIKKKKKNRREKVRRGEGNKKNAVPKRERAEKGDDE
jgi:hypothetical protein